MNLKGNGIISALLLIAVGVLLGIFLSQYSYFSIDKNVSVSDLFTCVISSVVAIYVANNIAKAISHSQIVTQVYFNETKDFLEYLKTFVTWVESKQIPLAELGRYGDKGMLQLINIIELVRDSKKIDVNEFEAIKSDFFALYEEIGLIRPLNGIIELSDEQEKCYYDILLAIKRRLLFLGIKTV